MLKAGRKLNKNDILKASSPEEFVKLVRRYLGIPEDSLLKIEELLYLCDKLSVKESAFYLEDDHCRFITSINENSMRLYDPGYSEIQEIPIVPILDNKIQLLTSFALSPDLENSWKGYKSNGFNEKYSRVHYLTEIEYRKSDDSVAKLGRLQFDGVNCIPLSIYAALRSEKFK